MDDLAADQFIASLVKSVQALCNGFIDFSSSIEVIGHIHLNIDRKVKLNYVLTEEVSKSVTEDATLFSSHSYHSKAPPSLPEEENDESQQRTQSSLETNPNHNRRKSQHVVRNDDSDSFILTPLPQPDVSTSTSIGAVGSLSKPQPSSADMPNSNSRRRKLLSSEVVSTSAKRSYTCDSDFAGSNPNQEMVEIKQEPEEDLSVYFQNNIPQESPGMNVVKSLKGEGMQSGDAVDGEQGHRLPFPIMLLTGSNIQLSNTSQPVAGPSTATQPMPSTRTEFSARGLMPNAKIAQTGFSIFKRSMKGKTPQRNPIIIAPGPAPKKAPKMPTPYATSTEIYDRVTASNKSNYLQYTSGDMEEAIELIHGGMSVIDAAMKYGIPRATLFNRSRDGCKTHTGRCSEVFLRTHVGVDLNKKRTKMPYTKEVMEKAIASVHDGMPVIDAAILHGIPRASLFIRSSKGCPSHTGRCSTVASNGKLRRTKVSRFQYKQLMEKKQELNPGESQKSSPNKSVSNDAVIPIALLPSIACQPTVALVKLPIAESQRVAEVPIEQPPPDVVPLTSAEPEQPLMEVEFTEEQDKSETVFETLSGNVFVKLETEETE